MRAAAPYLLLVAIVLIFFWPVWLAGYTFPIGGGDLWGVGLVGDGLLNVYCDPGPTRAGLEGLSGLS